MPTTLRNFAATLAAIGLLSVGSMTMGQQDAEQPPNDPTSIENIDQPADVADVQPADANEAARPDTPPEDPNSPADNTAAEADASAEADVSDESATSNSEADNESRESEDAASDRADSPENSADIRDENRDSSEGDNQLTPPEVPEQARDREANAREDVNADWRKIDRDGMVWFYSPSGQWHIRQGNSWHPYHDGMQHRDLNGGNHAYGDRSVVRDDGRAMNSEPQRHSTGYRGEEVQHSDQAQLDGQHVRYDRCGRAYVCVNGRAVYVDTTESSQAVQHTDDRQPTMADEQYQEVPPPPAMDNGDGGGDERGSVPMPPAPPSGT